MAVAFFVGASNSLASSYPSQLIYRPNGPVDAPNVFLDYNDLWPVFLASPVDRWFDIILDAGIVSGATLEVPARVGGDGVYDFQDRVTLKSRWGDALYGGYAEVTWAAGTKIINLTRVQSLFLRESSDGTSVYTQASVGPLAKFILFEGYFSGIGNRHAANAEFLSAVGPTLLVLGGRSFIISNLGKPAVVHPANATGVLNVYCSGTDNYVSGGYSGGIGTPGKAIKQASVTHSLNIWLFGIGDPFVETNALDTDVGTSTNVYLYNVGPYGISNQTFPQIYALGTLSFNNRTAASQNAGAIGLVAGTTQTQAGATQLPWGMSQTGTCANVNDGVRMPSARSEQDVIHTNDGAFTEQLWPDFGDNLGAGVNIPVTQAAGVTNHWIAIDDTNWRRVT
jgi:hypothetical protein